MKKYEEYPETYRFETVESLTELFKKDLNVTVVGVKGSSKSGLLKYITSTKPIPNLKLCYIDLSSLFNSSLIEFANLINSSILSSFNKTREKINSVDKLTKELDEIMLIENEYNKFVLILDNFDNLLEFHNNTLIKYIKFLYETFHGKITFAFGINHLKYLSEFRKGFPEELSPLQNQCTFFIGMISENEIKPEHLRKPIQIDSKTLYKLTGGYPAYLKLFENNQTTEENTNALSYDIWNSLSQEYREILRNIYLKKSVKESRVLQDLIELKIILKEENNYIVRSDYFNKFLEFLFKDDSQKKEEDIDSKLTDMESKVFRLLKKANYEIVNKEEIALNLWGENYNSKYSFWAIDQIISRLRKKLKKLDSNLSISTLKGRGYTLK